MSDNQKRREIVKFIEDHILFDVMTYEIDDMVEVLPGDPEDAAEDFCDHYQLGEWFWEAITVNDISIRDELSAISVKQKALDEVLQNEESMTLQDMQLT